MGRCPRPPHSSPNMYYFPSNHWGTVKIPAESPTWLFLRNHNKPMTNNRIKPDFKIRLLSMLSKLIYSRNCGKHKKQKFNSLRTVTNGDIAYITQIKERQSKTCNYFGARLWTVDDRAFPFAAARVWNSLPCHVTSARSLSVYCSRLKSHLFKQSFPLLQLL